MAKYCTTIVAFALFCLLTLTLAGTLPENDESTTQVSVSRSEAANENLRLPSEPVNIEASPYSVVESSVPLTKMTFRPVNRRFHVRSKRPCRHHFRFYPAVRENVEIPYGNDMLVASGENSDFQEPVLHGEGRRIPIRWMRMHHHHHDGGNSEDEDRLKKMVFKHYNRFDWERKLKKLRKHLHSEEEEKKTEGGLMKRMRKFLGHYF